MQTDESAATGLECQMARHMCSGPLQCERGRVRAAAAANRANGARLYAVASDRPVGMDNQHVIVNRDAAETAGVQRRLMLHRQDLVFIRGPF
jgi:hypothetical protein